jgi:catechol 2,3-dioxygenase-like lactoylglutathione lyase family enzyme
VFDHVTLRVPDLAVAERLFQTLLDQLAYDETLSSDSIALWEDFSLTQAEDAARVTRRAHVAFLAPSPHAVDEFRAAGVRAGLAEAEPPPGAGPGADPAAVLRDAHGNRFEAVARGRRRSHGHVDRVVMAVADVAAAARFYAIAATAAGFDAEPADGARAAFAGRADGGALVLVGGEPTAGLHLAFPGDDEAVRRFYADATAAGHRGNGEPGERARYHAGYFASYVLDPDGNNIEVVDHHRAR